MALLLETTLGDLVIDLDVEGSPALCKNMLQLAESRFYSQTLIYNIQANRFCQLGDPHGDGTGGACYQAILDGEDVTKSSKRFLRSLGRRLTHAECQQRGRVVATEMKGIPDTIGSQFLITLAEGPGMSLDGYTVVEDEGKKTSETHDTFLSLGRVTEDEDNVLQQLATLYCDAEGRPFVDVRIKRALVIHNPFAEDYSQEQSTELKSLMKRRGVQWDDEEEDRIIASPEYDRPLEERVKPRIAADQVDLVDDEDDEALERLQKQQAEEAEKHDAKSRAVVLEMLGDLPDADIRAPENVLFVCKLNPVTEDEDLELIFSRFDNNVKAEIIRDQDTGVSLQYAFIEFTENKQAEEAYFKMNNALVDDRRIKVDFSQSVAKIWDRYNQKLKPTSLQHGDFGGGRGAGGRSGGRDVGGRGGRGRGMDFRGGGGSGGDRFRGGQGRQDSHRNNNQPHPGQGHHSSHPPTQSRRDSSGGGSRERERHNNSQTGRDSKRNGPRGRGDHGRFVDDSGSARRPSLDEFGRVRVLSEGKTNDDIQQRDRRSVSPPRERRRGHRRSRSRSRSRDRSASSPDRRRHSRRRSPSPSTDESDRRSRKHHSSSRKHKKKKKHRHHKDDNRRRRDYDSDEDSRASSGDGKRSSKRRYSEDESEGQKRRHDCDASDDRRQRKHSQHHKRRKRSRSR
jgi:peptidyl-prolyl cis-trans isomerase-like 4